MKTNTTPQDTPINVRYFATDSPRVCEHGDESEIYAADAAAEGRHYQRELDEEYDSTCYRGGPLPRISKLTELVIRALAEALHTGTHCICFHSTADRVRDAKREAVIVLRHWRVLGVAPRVRYGDGRFRIGPSGVVEFRSLPPGSTIFQDFTHDGTRRETHEHHHEA